MKLEDLTRGRKWPKSKVFTKYCLGAKAKGEQIKLDRRCYPKFGDNSGFKAKLEVLLK